MTIRWISALLLGFGVLAASASARPEIKVKKRHYTRYDIASVKSAGVEVKISRAIALDVCNDHTLEGNLVELSPGVFRVDLTVMSTELACGSRLLKYRNLKWRTHLDADENGNTDAVLYVPRGFAVRVKPQ